MSKPLIDRGFACPKYVQNNFKKQLTSPCYFEILLAHTVTIEQKQKHMRTKTLLIAAAALAVGAGISMAQTFSQNIVGYVNVSAPAGANVLLANPLDDGTNTTTSLGQALPNKSTISVWTGTSFATSTKVGGVWTPDQSIPVGTGFFVNAKTATNIVFVGNVIAASGASVTNVPLGTGTYELVGEQIPYTVASLNDTNLSLGLTLPNKSTIAVWAGTSFSTSTKVGGVWTPDAAIIPGQGVFVNAKTATNWVQKANY
jgi:hypothetical protein